MAISGKEFFAKSDYGKVKTYLKEAREKYGYRLHYYVFMTNRRAGELFSDLSYSAVAKAQQRFSAKLDKDRSLRKIINKITAKMSHVKP